jgi:hypothetical protein
LVQSKIPANTDLTGIFQIQITQSLLIAITDLVLIIGLFMSGLNMAGKPEFVLQREIAKKTV